MPGLNGQPTEEEVIFYKNVLAKALDLNRLRSVSPPDLTAIQKMTDELVKLINSDPPRRWWTKIVDNPLKNATDILRSSSISPDINHAIQQHLNAAIKEAEIAEKESIEKNPFNQIRKGRS